MIKKLKVDGMTCSHCEKSVKDALVIVDGVSDVAVNLETKIVTVEGSNLDENIMKNAIDDIGFEVSEIEYWMKEKLKP